MHSIICSHALIHATSFLLCFNQTKSLSNLILKTNMHVFLQNCLCLFCKIGISVDCFWQASFCCVTFFTLSCLSAVLFVYFTMQVWCTAKSYPIMPSFNSMHHHILLSSLKLMHFFYSNSIHVFKIFIRSPY